MQKEFFFSYKYCISMLRSVNICQDTFFCNIDAYIFYNVETFSWMKRYWNSANDSFELIILNKCYYFHYDSYENENRITYLLGFLWKNKNIKVYIKSQNNSMSFKDFTVFLSHSQSCSNIGGFRWHVER